MIRFVVCDKFSAIKQNKIVVVSRECGYNGRQKGKRAKTKITDGTTSARFPNFLLKLAEKLMSNPKPVRENVTSSSDRAVCILCGASGTTQNHFCLECSTHSLNLEKPKPEDFFDDKNRELDYLIAPELARMGRLLIAHYEDDFACLEETEIDYFWKRKGGKSGGNDVLGKCVKVTGPLKFYSQKDFLIWLAADNCYHANYFQLTATVFHELKHAGKSIAEDKTELIGHDFEGFNREIEVFGSWRNNAFAMQKAFEKAFQPKLFE